MKKIYPFLFLLLLSVVACKKKSDDNPSPSSKLTSQDLSNYTWLIDRYTNEDFVLFDEDTLYLASKNQGNVATSVILNKALQGDFELVVEFCDIKGNALNNSGDYSILFTDKNMFDDDAILGSGGSIKQVLTGQATINTSYLLPYTSNGTIGSIDLTGRTGTNGTFKLKRTGSQIVTSISDPVDDGQGGIDENVYEKTYTNMYTGDVYFSQTIGNESSTKFEIKISKITYTDSNNNVTEIPLTSSTAYSYYNNYK